MTQLPTNRTTASTIAEHTSDHNILCAQHNDLDGHAADTAAHDVDATIADAIAALVATAPGTLDTLNELAAALGDDADFAATITTALAGKSATGHGHAESDVTSLVSDLAGKAATGHNHTGTYEPSGTIATHESDTTAVHGITDTSVLATDAEVATAVSDHAAAANPHPTYETSAEAAQKVTDHEAAANPHPTYHTAAEVATDIATHSADATSVHGIADTSVLATATTLATAVSDHSADTTAVHGIADTSALALTGHTHSAYVPLSTIDAAGDLLVGTADNTVGRLAKGTGLQVLRVNSGATALEFATPSSGNDSRLILFASTADQFITGTSILDITNVAFAVEANSTYMFSIAVDITASAGSSPTHTYQFTGPALPTRVSIRRIQMPTGSSVAISLVTAFASNFTSGATAANVKNTFEGIIVNGVNAGTVQLRVTPGGTTPLTTVGAGSGGWAMKIA